MSRLVATVPLTFQRFPIIPGTYTRHGRDKETNLVGRLRSADFQGASSSGDGAFYETH